VSPALLVHYYYYSLGFIYSKKSGSYATVRGIKLVLLIASGGIPLYNYIPVGDSGGNENPVKALSPCERGD